MTSIKKDKQFIWHPYTQEKTASPIIPIVRGKAEYLIAENGDKYIDAISSWWVNMHGHAHPYISKKIFEQSNLLEQVIFAGFTHPKAIELSERILTILPSNQSKVFFSDDGSTAVEVALKMAIQFRYNTSLSSGKKNNKKNRILALEGAYHGDTFGSMSISGRSVFTQPFSSLLFEVDHLAFPYPGKENLTLKSLKNKIRRGDISCFIFEPLIQGAAGMRTYNAEVLDEMISICHKNDIICIADEVMTGFARTAKMFACDYLKQKPDIICLSKGITGGFLPLGLTSCSKEIYEAFLSEEKSKTFFHGHSYTANPLACAAACANLDLFEKENTWKGIYRIRDLHQRFAGEIKGHPAVKSIRQLGTIIALELASKNPTSYLNESSKEIYTYFMKRRIVLRPLGNIIYIMPPYCIKEKALKKIYASIKEFLEIRKNAN